MKKLFAALIIGVMLSTAAYAALPQPTGYVNDFAGILTDTQGLESALRSYEQSTTIEIAVVTIDGLPEDQTLFTYGVELFEEWGIGKRGEDNGILVLINKQNVPGNRLRIELGYGVQGYITGSESGRILDDAVPPYEQGDYQLAAEIILNGLSEQLASYVPGERQADVTRDVLVPMIPFFFFIAILLISLAVRSRCPHCHGKLKCTGDVCGCTKCGRKTKRARNRAFILVGGGGFGGGGGGGFGGGMSGGGGAGR